jgi:hypothetical protein
MHVIACNYMQLHALHAITCNYMQLHKFDVITRNYMPWLITCIYMRFHAFPRIYNDLQDITCYTVDTPISKSACPITCNYMHYMQLHTITSNYTFWGFNKFFLCQKYGGLRTINAVQSHALASKRGITDPH